MRQKTSWELWLDSWLRPLQSQGPKGRGDLGDQAVRQKRTLHGTEETCSYTSNTSVFTSWRKKEDESKYIVNTEIHEGAFPSSGLKPDRQPAVTSMTTRPGGSTLAQAIRHSLQKCFLTTHCLKSQWNICARSQGAENQSKSGVEEGAPHSCPTLS